MGPKPRFRHRICSRTATSRSVEAMSGRQQAKESWRTSSSTRVSKLFADYESRTMGDLVYSASYKLISPVSDIKWPIFSKSETAPTFRGAAIKLIAASSASTRIDLLPQKSRIVHLLRSHIWFCVPLLLGVEMKVERRNHHGLILCIVMAFGAIVFMKSLFPRLQHWTRGRNDGASWFISSRKII